MLLLPGKNAHVLPGVKADSPPGKNAHVLPGVKADSPPGKNAHVLPDEATPMPPAENADLPSGKRTAVRLTKMLLCRSPSSTGGQFRRWRVSLSLEGIPVPGGHFQPWRVNLSPEGAIARPHQHFPPNTQPFHPPETKTPTKIKAPSPLMSTLPRQKCPPRT